MADVLLASVVVALPILMMFLLLRADQVVQLTGLAAPAVR
jgi:hypothetical protein